MSEVAAPAPSAAPTPAASPKPTASATPAADATKTVTFQAKAKPAAPAPESTKTGAGAAARTATPEVAPPAEETKPTGPEKRAYKYKANKEEVVEELSDEEIVQRLSKARGADKAFQERAALEKDFREFLVALKADPWSVLKDPALGVNLEELAQQRLADEYEKKLADSKLTPEQREAKAAKEEAEHYRKQIEAIENQKREAAETEYRQKVEQTVHSTLEAALRELDIDATPEALAEAAQVMKLNLKHRKEFGEARLTPKQIAEEVRARQNTRNERFHKSVVNNLKGEKLLNYLGGLDSPVIQALFDAIPPDSAPAKKLMLARLAKLKGVESFAAAPAPRAEQPTKEEKKPFDRAAWRREFILNREE